MASFLKSLLTMGWRNYSVVQNRDVIAPQPLRLMTWRVEGLVSQTLDDRFGHAEGHERLLNGVELNHRTTDCREHPNQPFSDSRGRSQVRHFIAIGLFCGRSAKVFRGQNERRATRQHSLCRRPSVRHQTATPQHPIRLHPPIPAAGNSGVPFSPNQPWSAPSATQAWRSAVPLADQGVRPASRTVSATSRTSSLRQRPCSMTRAGRA